MSAVENSYLADLYRLEELEGWKLLARHLELTDGFSFVVVLAPDDHGIAFIRSRLPDLIGLPGAIRRVTFDPAAGAGGLTEALLKITPLPDYVRLVWIDADPVEPEHFAQRDDAWRIALSRLNRHRNVLQERFHCTVAIAGPMSLQTILREAAPDLWSIRSGVFRIEPAGSARASGEGIFRSYEESVDPEGMGLPGDPAETLAEAQKIRGKPGKEIVLAQLLRRAGRQAYRLLQWELAIQCLQEAYSLEESHGGDPELRVLIASDIAIVFHKLAKWDRAIRYSKKALEDAEMQLGPTHTVTATALNNLSGLLQATNRLAEAEPLMRRALAIDERSFGADHPNVAIRLNNLAGLLKATNRLAEAEPLLRRALAIDERSFGADHPNVARDLNNLAALLHATNRLAEAEPLLRRALAIDERSFGADHPNVARDLNNLTQLLQDTNRLAEAEPLMRRALAIDERSFGPEHPNVARDLNNLAQLLKATNRMAEAEPLMRRVVAIIEKSMEEYCPNLATALNNLAALHQATNRLAEAEPLMRRALAIDERSFGADHPDVATDLNNLAMLLQATNRLAEAEPLSRRHVGIFLEFTRRTGHEHPHLRTALGNYESILNAQGRGEAEIKEEIEKLKAEHA